MFVGFQDLVDRRIGWVVGSSERNRRRHLVG